MKRTAQILPEYLLRIAIVGIVVIFLGSCVAQACKRWPSQQENVDEVLETINAFADQKENDFKFFSVRMGEDTAFLGFYKNQNEIKTLVYSLRNNEYTTIYPVSFERPKDKCSIEKDCFCFCKNVKGDGNFKCDFEDLTCIEGNFYFSMESLKDCESQKRHVCFKDFDGFIMFKKIKYATLDTKRIDKAIYIEKIGNMIGICEKLVDNVRCI